MGIFLKSFFIGKKLKQDKDGVAAIEFTLLAPIFFALIFGTIEMGYLFLKINMLNNAVAVVSKVIYTGAASDGSVTYEDIEDSICENIYFVGSNCAGNLHIELTEISSFSDFPTTVAECEDTDLNITPSVSYNPGSAKSIIFMRACFMTDILMPGLAFGLNLEKTANNKFAIISSTAFVNEPF
jgi:Flp pilus assembly protein TadG